MNEQPRDLITTLETIRDFAYAEHPSAQYTALFRHLQRHIDQLIQERSNDRQEGNIRRTRP